MPALIEQPAPRSTEQRLGVPPCGLIASAMSSILRSDGAGVAGVPFAMVSDYVSILVTKSSVNASAEEILNRDCVLTHVAIVNECKGFEANRITTHKRGYGLQIVAVT